MEIRTPRRLPPTPSINHSHKQNATTHIVSMNQLSGNDPLGTTNCRNDAQIGLRELLHGNQIQDKIKQYCLDNISYNEMIDDISSEDPQKKSPVPRQRKGPWMSNRRDNRNTRKAKMFRFTQRPFQQNRRVAVNRILDSKLSLDNDDVSRDIEEVEKV